MRKKNIQDNLQIRRIDNHNRFAIDFFWEHGYDFFKKIEYSITNGDIEIFRVAFVGFGEYAYELLKVLCALGQLPRCRLIIYVFDKEADIKMSYFQKELLANRVNSCESCLKSHSGVIESGIDELKDIKYHDIPFYEIHFIKEDVEANYFIQNCRYLHFTHMFLMLGDDAKNIKVASDLCIENNRDSLPQPKYYVMVRNDETVLQLKNDNALTELYAPIEWIGADSERYDFNTISEHELEALGLSVHCAYAFNKKLVELFKCDDGGLINDEMPEYDSYAYELMVRELRRDWNTFNVQYFIGDISRDKYKNTLLWYVHEGAKQEIQSYFKKKLGYDVNISKDSVIEKFTTKRVTEFIDDFFDKKELERGYNKKEYYRRSSKARALFEKMMFSLGYLKYNTENGIVEPNNVVSEFGVDEQSWKLPPAKLNGSMLDQTFSPQNFPVFKLNKVAFEKSNPYYHTYKEVIDEADGYDNSLKSAEKQFSGTNSEVLYMYAPHINVQWFEVNNIFQKRWMVFRWSEGYIKMDEKRKDDGEQDLCSKTHKYLVPYIEIYRNFDSRMRHTLDVQIKGMAEIYGQSHK